MKKIVEYLDGFRWVDGNTSSANFEKDSDQYRDLIAQGCKVEIIPQATKDAYEAQQAQDAINQEAMKYLDDTDKFFTRFGETGKAMPKGMAKARAEARERIKV